MRRLTAILLVLVSCAAGLLSPLPAAIARAPLFHTEVEAQKHCPSDTVVWLNVPSGIYHYKGQRW
jgi:hypothetical protein